MKYKVIFRGGNADRAEERVIEAWTIVNDKDMVLFRDASARADIVLMVPNDRLISVEKIG